MTINSRIQKPRRQLTQQETTYGKYSIRDRYYGSSTNNDHCTLKQQRQKRNQRQNFDQQSECSTECRQYISPTSQHTQSLYCTTKEALPFDECEYDDIQKTPSDEKSLIDIRDTPSDKREKDSTTVAPFWSKILQGEILYNCDSDSDSSLYDEVRDSPSDEKLNDVSNFSNSSVLNAYQCNKILQGELNYSVEEEEEDDDASLLFVLSVGEGDVPFTPTQTVPRIDGPNEDVEDFLLDSLLCDGDIPMTPNLTKAFPSFAFNDVPMDEQEADEDDFLLESLLSDEIDEDIPMRLTPRVKQNVPMDKPEDIITYEEFKSELNDDSSIVARKNFYLALVQFLFQLQSRKQNYLTNHTGELVIARPIFSITQYRALFEILKIFLIISGSGLESNNEPPFLDLDEEFKVVMDDELQLLIGSFEEIEMFLQKDRESSNKVCDGETESDDGLSEELERIMDDKVYPEIFDYMEMNLNDPELKENIETACMATDLSRYDFIDAHYYSSTDSEDANDGDDDLSQEMNNLVWIEEQIKLELEKVTSPRIRKTPKARIASPKSSFKNRNNGQAIMVENETVQTDPLLEAVPPSQSRIDIEQGQDALVDELLENCSSDSKSTASIIDIEQRHQDALVDELLENCSSDSTSTSIGNIEQRQEEGERMDNALLENCSSDSKSTSIGDIEQRQEELIDSLLEKSSSDSRSTNVEMVEEYLQNASTTSTSSGEYDLEGDWEQFEELMNNEFERTEEISVSSRDLEATRNALYETLLGIKPLVFDSNHQTVKSTEVLSPSAGSASDIPMQQESEDDSEWSHNIEVTRKAVYGALQDMKPLQPRIQPIMPDTSVIHQQLQLHGTENIYENFPTLFSSSTDSSSPDLKKKSDEILQHVRGTSNQTEAFHKYLLDLSRENSNSLKGNRMLPNSKDNTLPSLKRKEQGRVDGRDDEEITDENDDPIAALDVSESKRIQAAEGATDIPCLLLPNNKISQMTAGAVKSIHQDTHSFDASKTTSEVKVLDESGSENKNHEASELVVAPVWSMEPVIEDGPFIPNVIDKTLALVSEQKNLCSPFLFNSNSSPSHTKQFLSLQKIGRRNGDNRSSPLAKSQQNHEEINKGHDQVKPILPTFKRETREIECCIEGKNQSSSIVKNLALKFERQDKEEKFTTCTGDDKRKSTVSKVEKPVGKDIEQTKSIVPNCRKETEEREDYSGIGCCIERNNQSTSLVKMLASKFERQDKGKIIARGVDKRKAAVSEVEKQRREEDDPLFQLHRRLHHKHEQTGHPATQDCIEEADGYKEDSGNTMSKNNSDFEKLPNSESTSVNDFEKEAGREIAFGEDDIRGCISALTYESIEVEIKESRGSMPSVKPNSSGNGNVVKQCDSELTDNLIIKAKKQTPAEKSNADGVAQCVSDLTENLVQKSKELTLQQKAFKLLLPEEEDAFDKLMTTIENATCRPVGDFDGNAEKSLPTIIPGTCNNSDEKLMATIENATCRPVGDFDGNAEKRLPTIIPGTCNNADESDWELHLMPPVCDDDGWALPKILKEAGNDGDALACPGIENHTKDELSVLCDDPQMYHPSAATKIVSPSSEIRIGATNENSAHKSTITYASSANVWSGIKENSTRTNDKYDKIFSSIEDEIDFVAEDVDIMFNFASPPGSMKGPYDNFLEDEDLVDLRMLTWMTIDEDEEDEKRSKMPGAISNVTKYDPKVPDWQPEESHQENNSQHPSADRKSNNVVPPQLGPGPAPSMKQSYWCHMNQFDVKEIIKGCFTSPIKFDKTNKKKKEV